MIDNNAVPKILIVDDISENLFALEKILKKLNVEIIKASSGNEALSYTLENDFALIILDVQMPGMDGYEVAGILKSDEKTETIPIIFVTAIDRDDSKEIEGYDKGAIDFIFKPLNEFVLTSKVKIFLELYEVRIGLERLVLDRTKNIRDVNIKLEEEIIKNKKVEKELINTKAHLDAIFDSMPSALISVDSEGKITGMNKGAEILSGISLKQAIGEMATVILSSFTSHLEKVIDTISNNEKFSIDKICISNNDDISYYNLILYPLIAEELKGAVIRIDDTTEKVRLEQMMIQSEKMLSVGGLAAGMAHEINNPLGGIMQSIQVIRRRIFEKLPKNAAVAEKFGISLDDIIAYMEERGIRKMLDSEIEAGERVSKIVNNMLSFARKDNSGAIPIDISILLDSTLQLVSGDYNLKKNYDFKQIKIIKEYQENMNPVPCESSKIQQVFLNILKNGAEAMTDSKTENPCFTIKVYESDDIVRIKISDNGLGMDEKCRKRIFEPFFTTKPVGVGTGLGLSVSYFIITEVHKGKMRVESEEGKGSCFIIDLPLI